MPPRQSFYDVLGVSRSASDEDIRRSFKRQALQLHPDKNPNGAEKFKALSEAYETLKDSKKRAEYDRLISPVSPRAPSQPPPQNYHPRNPSAFTRPRPETTAETRSFVDDLFKQDMEMQRKKESLKKREAQDKLDEAQEAIRRDIREREEAEQARQEKIEQEMRRKRMQAIEDELRRAKEEERRREEWRKREEEEKMRQREEQMAAMREQLEAERSKNMALVGSEMDKLASLTRRMQAREQASEARVKMQESQLEKDRVRAEAAAKRHAERHQESARVKNHLARRIEEIKRSQSEFNALEELRRRQAAEEEQRELEREALRARQQEQREREEAERERQADLIRKERYAKLGKATRSFMEEVAAQRAKHQQDIAAIREESDRMERETRAQLEELKKKKLAESQLGSSTGLGSFSLSMGSSLHPSCHLPEPTSPTSPAGGSGGSATTGYATQQPAAEEDFRLPLLD